MQKIFAIVKTNLIMLARDKKGLALTLGMPLILIVILGTALGSAMGVPQINPIAVALVNEDQPVTLPYGEVRLGDTMVQAFTGEEVARVLHITQGDDLAQAREQVARGEQVAVIHLPADFTQRLVSGESASVNLLTDSGRPTSVEIVRQVVGAVLDETTNQRLAARFGATPETVVLPELVRAASGVKPVSAMQYYAAAMTAMFVMTSGLARAQISVQERKQGTADRQSLSPTGRGVLVAGQMLSHLTVLYIQFLLLLFITRFVTHVDWGSIPAALTLGFCYAFAVAGITAFLSTFISDVRGADAMVGVIGMLFAALSGAMFPLAGFGEAMLKIAKLIPNYWALQGLTDQMSGLGTQALYLPVIVLLGIGSTLGAVGAWRLTVR